MILYFKNLKVVTGELDKLPEGSIFVYVDVGGRDYWKNKSNEFRFVFIFILLKQILSE